MQNTFLKEALKYEFIVKPCTYIKQTNKCPKSKQKMFKW